jgi:hypothetical protein
VSNELKKIKFPTEKNVAHYLDKKGIEYKYEVPICIIDEQNNQRIWYPDFYLPTLGIYLEVCGTPKDRIEKSRRKHVYKENQIPVVFLHYYKSDSKWKKYLEDEIEKIEDTRMNEFIKRVSSKKEDCEWH